MFCSTYLSQQRTTELAPPLQTKVFYFHFILFQLKEINLKKALVNHLAVLFILLYRVCDNPILPNYLKAIQ